MKIHGERAPRVGRIHAGDAIRELSEHCWDGHRSMDLSTKVTGVIALPSGGVHCEREE